MCDINFENIEYDSLKTLVEACEACISDQLGIIELHARDVKRAKTGLQKLNWILQSKLADEEIK